MVNSGYWSRRAFLQTISAGIPTLRLMSRAESPVDSHDPDMTFSPAKFTPIPLEQYFNSSSKQFGPRKERRPGDPSKDGLIEIPSGECRLRGIPFLLGQGGVDQKAFLVLRNEQSSLSATTVEIPLHREAKFICIAAFCDWDEAEYPPPDAGPTVIEKVGQQLAHIVLAYENEQEVVLPLRRRFEVNSPTVLLGHSSFLSVPHIAPGPLALTDALKSGKNWGDLQTTMSEEDGVLGICALQNPHPDRFLKGIKLQADGPDAVVLCGLTLFHGTENPLRYERLKLYRLTLPAPIEDVGQWKVDVDLGIVARTYLLNQFDAEQWLSSLQEPLAAETDNRHLFVEVSASPGATLQLRHKNRKKDTYDFDLSQVKPGLESIPCFADEATARIEIVEPDKVWLHCRILDEKTKKPTAVRVSFRSKEGRYMPPYGHRSEINDGWFQDYGADLRLRHSLYAYVDGTFQIELPVGDVYVEIVKGFEYQALRQKLTIVPGQRELDLEIARIADFRSEGWVSADTHVHFMSPATAVLEGQAEGLNLINLLAAQWGDLFTNVGDFGAGNLTSSDGEMLVQLGTENRQHILGHLGLLGADTPAFPMSASGPDESYFGDPLWCSMAEWADVCRNGGGLAVAAHFPTPIGEIAADIALGKIDAVEVVPPVAKYVGNFNSLPYLDWYRYLNCGYRLPVVSGTDKMEATTPAGAMRAYVHLGQEEFNFTNWAKAVRKGNTFATSGPLLTFHVDGHVPGDQINLQHGTATLEFRVRGKSVSPFHGMEIVANGVVVATREYQTGTTDAEWRDKILVTGPGWIAARCFSILPDRMWAYCKVQAHTSAIYLVVPGKQLFSAPVASYMLALIDGAQTWAETLATRPNSERFARILKVFQDARSELHRRLHQHGIEH